MSKTDLNLLTIELEGGATQVRELSNQSIKFFKESSKESAKAAGIKTEVWKLMSEQTRIKVHCERIVHDIPGYRNYKMEY